MYDAPMTLEEALQDPRLRRLAGFPEAPGAMPAPAPVEMPTEDAPLQEAASMAPEQASQPDFAAMTRRYLAAKGAGKQVDRLTRLDEGFKDATETVLAARGMKLGRSAPPASQEASARQAYQDELGTARTQAEIAKAGRVAAPKAGSVKAAKSTDPKSPESIRAQGLVKDILGDNITDATLATMSEADADSILKYGTAKAQRGIQTAAEVGKGRRFNASELRQAQQFAQRLGFDISKEDTETQLAWARIALGKEGLTDAKEARASKAAETAAAKTDSVQVPGFDVTPGETPTVKDAETLKTINSANGELKRGIAELRRLHTQYGTEWGGKGGVPMRQAMTSLKLAGKTIAELGALSGPDMGLMNDLAGGDPSTIEASAKSFFGVDNTDEAMSALEQWAERRIAAASEARGYRPRPAGAPARVPASKALPKDAAGNPTLAAPAPGTGVRKQYSKKANRTRELDAAGKVIREYEGPPHG